MLHLRAQLGNLALQLVALTLLRGIQFHLNLTSNTSLFLRIRCCLDCEPQTSAAPVLLGPEPLEPRSRREAGDYSCPLPHEERARLLLIPLVIRPKDTDQDVHQEQQDGEGDNIEHDLHRPVQTRHLWVHWLPLASGVSDEDRVLAFK